MSRTASVVLGAVAMFGLTVFGSEKPPDAYSKNMKETNVAAQELRKNLDAKDYEAIAKKAATLKTLFDNTLSFWESRKAEDAIAVAKTGSKAAADLEAAAKAKNEETVVSTAKTLNATCKTCHDVHRERLPDGTSEIK